MFMSVATNLQKHYTLHVVEVVAFLLSPCWKKNYGSWSLICILSELSTYRLDTFL